MFKEFKKFILRGNLVDLAIGFTVGSAFSTVAKSLVNDILMPPIGFLLGNTDFTNMYWVLKAGSKSPGPYETLSAAESAGAITINLGRFINNILALLVVAVAMFVVIKALARVDNQLDSVRGKKNNETDKMPTNKKCKYCLTVIPYKATKCLACCSELPIKRKK